MFRQESSLIAHVSTTGAVRARILDSQDPGDSHPLNTALLKKASNNSHINDVISLQCICLLYKRKLSSAAAVHRVHMHKQRCQTDGASIKPNRLLQRSLELAIGVACLPSSRQRDTAIPVVVGQAHSQAQDLVHLSTQEQQALQPKRAIQWT